MCSFTLPEICNIVSLCFTFEVIQESYCFNMVYFILRILWFFIVVIGVTLFVYQVTDRIIVYYQRNTNVDVAVKYVSSVEFPSVTVCNQNQFRYLFLIEWIYLTLLFNSIQFFKIKLLVSPTILILQGKVVTFSENTNKNYRNNLRKLNMYMFIKSFFSVSHATCNLRRIFYRFINSFFFTNWNLVFGFQYFLLLYKVNTIQRQYYTKTIIFQKVNIKDVRCWGFLKLTFSYASHRVWLYTDLNVLDFTNTWLVRAVG